MIEVLHEDGVQAFRETIARRLGLQFEDSKFAFLGEVLERRLAATGRALGGYLDALSASRADEPELHELARELTVGETYFFRHMAQFRAFQRVVDEWLATTPEPRRLRVWSAGCASGEEAFSLAILLHERSAAGPAFQYEVHASDLNRAALARATRGRYSKWSMRETTDAHVEQWFRREGSEYVLHPSIRDSVTFTQQNLIEPLPLAFVPGSFDVIFCRNVLMYFAPETARRVIAKLAALLSPQGHLFLGHAESLRGLSHDFHLRHFCEAFYYQRKHGERTQGGVPDASPRWLEEARGAAFVQGPAPALESWVQVVERASERVKQLTEPREPLDVAASRAQPEPSPHGLGDALHLLEQERFEQALELLAEAVPTTTTDPDALLLRAALLTHRGDFAEAAKVAEQLVELDELSAGAHYLLALCCEGQGSNERAMEYYRMAAHLDPTFAMPRLHLGLLTRRAGDRETAERELRTASELLHAEDASRLLLFGGGFRREGLIAMCQGELKRLGGER